MGDHSALVKRAANAYNSRLAHRRPPYSQQMYDQDPLTRQYADAEQQQMLFNMEFPPLDTSFNSVSGSTNPPAMPLSLMETRETFPVGQNQLYTPFQEVSKPPQLRRSPWLEPSPGAKNDTDGHGQETRQEMTRLCKMVESHEATILDLTKQVEGNEATILGLTNQVENDSRRRAELSKYAEELAKWTESVQIRCDDALKECRAMNKK
ncbi:hypothetical protein V496_01056 [Pseudogymnoascus sp. VKM F-4515 (FW-2607)]|nr:hypothetical protein V496_01056 [Pseudogymnoascus sp. VKM F-4515 (FW-2607)]